MVHIQVATNTEGQQCICLALSADDMTTTAEGVPIPAAGLTAATARQVAQRLVDLARELEGDEAPPNELCVVGARVVDGELAVECSLPGIASDRRERIFLPERLAFITGCALAEMSAVAVEKQAELRQSGKLLRAGDVANFSERLNRRFVVNGATISGSWDACSNEKHRAPLVN